MSYSVSVRARTKKLQVLMFGFMESHYRRPSEIFRQKDDYSRFTSNHLSDEATHLSYDSHARAIGFDYSACEPERDYIFDVCRWMALKIGKVKEFKHLPFPVSCYCYDGLKNIPILAGVSITQIKPEHRNTFNYLITTKLGYKSIIRRYSGVPAYEEARRSGEAKKYIEGYKELYSEMAGMPYEKLVKTIKKELRRLEGIWCRKYAE